MRPRIPHLVNRLWMCLAAAVALSATTGNAQPPCTGDCNDSGAVAINELIVGVNIALGSAAVALCTNVDADGDEAVSVAELISAVNNGLGGCPGAPTPTPTATPRGATPTLALGPVITFFGLTSADDSPQPTPTGSAPIPIFERPFGFGFSLVIEAGLGAATCPPPPAQICDPGTSTFLGVDPPDLQVQVTRPLGDGSAAVCDNGAGEPPVFGGVPGIDPPRLDEPSAIAEALNDLGCRFVDGIGEPDARTCGGPSGGPCVRFADGEFGCIEGASRSQFCAPVPTTLQFPIGDTLVSARLRDVAGNLGPVAQIIVRVVP